MSEHDQQVYVIQWCQMHETQYPELSMIFAVPNAGKRSIGAARYYLAEGLKSGVPDIILPIPRDSDFIEDEHPGLAIEMKDGKNKTTDNQKWWLERLTHYGWKTLVAYSADEAINAIKKYLNMEVEA